MSRRCDLRTTAVHLTGLTLKGDRPQVCFRCTVNVPSFFRDKDFLCFKQRTSVDSFCYRISYATLGLIAASVLLSCEGNSPGTGTTEVGSSSSSLSISATTPTNGAINVSTSSALTATFSEPVNPATVTAATFTINPPVTGAITVTGTTAMFAPSTSWAPSTLYTGTLTTGIKDLAGNALLSTFSWSFTTGAGGTTSGTGLDFPGSAAVPDGQTIRFKFTNPLAIYPATYIWKAYPRQQNQYYTAFFWGNDDGNGNFGTFLWDQGNSNTYYGAHPYPNFPDVSTHKWEIATDRGGDFVSSELVTYDRWYTQALVAWADSFGKHTAFYWDLPNTSKVIMHVSPTNYGNTNPPSPALTWGDAPWAPGNEVWNGILRGIQVYSMNLSLVEIQSEITTPQSTAAGVTNIWYLNLNPTPTDISDKSGKGHHPSWIGNLRPTLFTE